MADKGLDLNCYTGEITESEITQSSETLAQKKARLRSEALITYNTNVASYKNQVLAAIYADGANQEENIETIRREGAAAKQAYLDELARIKAITN